MKIAVGVIRPWESVISCPVWQASTEMIIWVRFNFKETVSISINSAGNVLDLQKEPANAT